jgi:ribosomal protein S18 acetylase RimI-like enzyme
VILRAATAADAPALARLATDSFVAAFGHLYRPEDLAAFLAEHRSAERYRADLADPAKRVRVAELDGDLTAYCLIAFGRAFDERPQPRPRDPVFLSQLYCAPRMAGRGLGAALMDWAIGEARAAGADAIQLSVFSENHGAQRFYRRHGFVHVADIDFWVGGHRDHEFLYELALERSTMDTPGGGQGAKS